MSAQSPEELNQLYRELILDHARSPRHFGKLEDASHQADGINPLCGDKLRLYLNVDANDVIREVSFEGSGCAISVASASLLTDAIRGLSVHSALVYGNSVKALLAGKDKPVTTTEVDLGKLEALEGVRQFPTRIKCATLAWHGLDSALRDDITPASTE